MHSRWWFNWFADVSRYKLDGVSCFFFRLLGCLRIKQIVAIVSHMIIIINDDPPLIINILWFIVSHFPEGPGGPIDPFWPGLLGGPDGPLSPLIPLLPFQPLEPLIPFKPLNPAFPAKPFSPRSPFTPTLPRSPNNFQPFSDLKFSLRMCTFVSFHAC